MLKKELRNSSLIVLYYVHKDSISRIIRVQHDSANVYISERETIVGHAYILPQLSGYDIVDFEFIRLHFIKFN